MVLSRRLLTAAAALTAALSLAGTAQATVTPTTLTTTASNAGAATRPDFTVAFNMTVSPSSDDAKKMVIDLPAGLLGDVQNIARCTAANLNADNCASATKLGDVDADVDATVIVEIPLSVPGEIYNLPPQGTEAARMGIVLRPLGGILGKIFLQASIRLRPADYGLQAILDGLPRQHSGLDIRMNRMAMTLLGSNPAGKPFISAPTSCVAATTRVEVTSYAAATREATKSYTPNACGSVPFAPSAAVSATPATPDSPAQTDVTLTIPDTATPRVQSHAKSATITLPEGMEINPAAASAGLGSCDDAQFGTGSGAPAACPADSAVGDVSIVNPQLGTLTGSVFLGKADPSQPTQLMRLLIVAQRSAVADDARVKLTGGVTADPATGRVVTQLNGIPQVPFRTMTMRLRGGPNAILRTPRACGDFTMGTSLVPWSGTAAATPGATLRIATGCGDPARFAPTLALSASPAKAGVTTALKATIARSDGDARIAGATLSLPNGLMGKLVGLPQCPTADARAASCSAATKVGSASATVGTGSAPLTLPGELFLTPPTSGGLAGLALVIDAQVGPLALGRVSVPMELKLREGGAGIDVVAGDIPRRIQGIPLDLRQIDLTIDRDGFLVNPTSCAPLTLSGTLTSDLGATVNASAPYAVTGCGELQYAPRMRMSFDGEIKKNGHPAITSVLSLGAGQANTQEVSLLLPEGVAPDSERLRNACPLATAQAGACPAKSKIGEASATTPALPEQLRGPVNLVMAPGSPLPELFVRLDGAARIDMRGKVQFAKGRTKVVFDGVPDVPLDDFSLKLVGGLRGAIATARDLCTGSAPKVDASMRAHSGAKRTVVVEPGVEGCRAGTGGAKITMKVRRLRGGAPILQLTAKAGDAALKTVRVTLPKGYRIDAKRARKLATVKGTKRGRSALKAGKRTLTLNLGSRGARTVTLTLRKGAVRVSSVKTQKAKRVKIAVRATPTSGLPTTLTLSVKPAKR
ncbi:MAG: hypothetical protein JHC95_12960 [Solirubrobacteraceae bacterium]|nr:hypothetical protein [Solirubrobacteraceae bacterium]